MILILWFLVHFLTILTKREIYQGNLTFQMIPSFMMHWIPRKNVPIKGQIVWEAIFCLCALQAKRPIKTLPKQTNQRVPMTSTCVQVAFNSMCKAVNSSQNIDGIRNNKYATNSLTKELLYIFDGIQVGDQKLDQVFSIHSKSVP